MKEKIKQILPIFFFIVAIVFPLNTNARSGCCSWHGGVCGCSCCDGTSLSATCAPYYPECGGGYYNPTPNNPPSMPSCPSMSYYDSLSDSCKCYTGYVVSGNKCISKDQWCKDKYGYNATSDYLSDNCKCMSGYIFGKDVLGNISCVSADQLCRDQYGVMARYNSLYDKCECFVGYVLGEDAIGRNQCISEDSWCHNKYGYNSRYNILTDKCECNEGYILGDNGCVIQQKTITCPLNSTLIGDQCFCDSGYIASGSSCITYTQNCQNKYGVNSYGDKNYCYCNSGYEMNSDKTSCIKSIICPINSTKVGQNCICNEGFVSKNDQCISYTEDCRLTFGDHVIGHEGQPGLNNSNCDCEKDYIWNSSRTVCVQIEAVSTTIVTTKPVTNTTKAVLENKNQEISIATQTIEVENTSDGKLINSSTTEYQQEAIKKETTQNWFTKTLGLIHTFLLRLFK